MRKLRDFVRDERQRRLTPKLKMDAIVYTVVEPAGPRATALILDSKHRLEQRPDETFQAFEARVSSEAAADPVAVKLGRIGSASLSPSGQQLP
jgi:hypothetical protein